MQLFVGLGNPGEQYARQRHNVGFMVLDRIAAARRFGPWRNKFSSLITDGYLGSERVQFLKPQTFMNRSGFAVLQAAQFFKLGPDEIVVLHDELDLAPGKVRIRTGGGVAGHNGLRSLAQQLGTTDFRRVRIGIGHPGHKDRVTGHVLGNFAPDDREWLDALLDALDEAAPLVAAGDDAGAMNRIALRMQPLRESTAREVD
jgi:PTH1 family peptidyl-tRNA hydrolase